MCVCVCVCVTTVTQTADNNLPNSSKGAVSKATTPHYIQADPSDLAPYQTAVVTADSMSLTPDMLS